MELQETEQPAICRRLKLQYAVILVAVLVEIIYLSKGVLLMYRYLHRSNVCVNHTIQPAEDDDSPEFERDNRGYVFTVFLFGIISFLRLVEYIPLFIGLWQYWDSGSDRQNNSDSCGLNEHKHYFIFVLLTPVSVISLSLPAIGLSLENRCGDANITANVFIAYCIINFFRYTWAFSVRIGMVFATLKVKEIWKTDIQISDEETPASLTSKYRKAGEKVKKIARIFETWFLFPWIIFFLVSSLKAKNILSLWNDEEEEVRTLPLVYFLLYNINQMIFLVIPYLCVRKMNHYHHQCVERIQERHHQCVQEQHHQWVERIQEQHRQCVERIQEQHHQCVERIQEQHHQCVQRIQEQPRQCVERIQEQPHQCVEEQQLNPGREDGCVAEQRKLQVDENYDVEPRVWGLGFKVKIKGFVYTLFLITGLVFTILTPLL